MSHCFGTGMGQVAAMRERGSRVWWCVPANHNYLCPFREAVFLCGFMFSFGFFVCTVFLFLSFPASLSLTLLADGQFWFRGTVESDEGGNG